MSRSLVIFLHGVGSRGADLTPLGEAGRDVLTDTDFAAPDAPFAFDQASAGRQWFSIRGVTEENRPGRVAGTREAFDGTLRNIVAAHGLDGHPGRVALVGFSQGAIMALDALTSGRWPVAAVVAFSGRLASPEPLTPSPATRALLVHGDADPVMPPRESEVAARRLRNAGVEVRHHLLPGLGHTISGDGAALALTFLADAFRARSRS
ncbi:alpha/beta hydrolase [Bosea minatitlanensis]|jgi:phospholipase/carboxylesterase|uniref:Alpha/beta hydrolase n=1 Tax=Bosea minatitlanensis TaxID=128782 RepID=A0ABW0F5D1_9HYPH|nr:prolyl oligopeptidase family serine peptidase [Bosea minatitlanensis]MCT4494031.1 prolyl oligopeptidase family serine peptidase [Bosea minatitlanensis]